MLKIRLSMGGAKKRPVYKIVVADIGGTNARFQVCTSQNFLFSLMSNLVQAWSIDFECGDALDFEKVRIY